MCLSFPSGWTGLTCPMARRESERISVTSTLKSIHRDEAMPAQTCAWAICVNSDHFGPCYQARPFDVVFASVNMLPEHFFLTKSETETKRGVLTTINNHSTHTAAYVPAISSGMFRSAGECILHPVYIAESCRMVLTHWPSDARRHTDRRALLVVPCSS